MKRERFHPLHIWRLPVSRKKFWMVAIYPDGDEMNRWLRALPGKKDSKTYLACCIRMSKRGCPGFLGYVVFSKEQIGGGLVAHELVHAACRTLLGERYRSLSYQREERLAQLVEHLVRQFWQKWYRYAAEAA